MNIRHNAYATDEYKQNIQQARFRAFGPRTPLDAHAFILYSNITTKSDLETTKEETKPSSLFSSHVVVPAQHDRQGAGRGVASRRLHHRNGLQEQSQGHDHYP